MVRFTTAQRIPGTTAFESQEHHEKLMEVIRTKAREAGLTLESETPAAGWVTSAHSRDGKSWPCKEKTNGARPVWIWRAS